MIPTYLFFTTAHKNHQKYYNEATTTEPTTLFNAVYDTTCKVITVIQEQ